MSGEQYLRVVHARIAGGPTFTYDGSMPEPRDGIGGPGFRITFEATQRDGGTPNILHLRITNLADSTSQVAFFENKEVTLSAGYVGQEYLLFRGQIRQARNLREQVVDKVLDILATDASQPRNYAVAVGSLDAGHSFRDRADLAFDAFRKMGVKIGYVAPLMPNIKAQRSFAFLGNAKDLMRQICQTTKTSWSIQNGVLQVVPNDQPKPGAAIVLNSKTGLVDLPIQTIQGIEATCLLNGRIVPTCAVRIDEKSIQRAAFDFSYEGEKQIGNFPGVAINGLYKVYLVNHRGDTRGNQFYTFLTGTRLSDGHISIAMGARGIDSDYSSAKSTGTGAGTGNGGTGSGTGTDSTGPSVEVGPITTNLDPPTATNPGEL